jgi:hypothetical protein
MDRPPTIHQSRGYRLLGERRGNGDEPNFWTPIEQIGSDDFIELNSSGTTINADTSRVDAFGRGNTGR